MLKAIRQAGSIKKLKSDIENLSYSKDYGSFPKNGEFGDYKKFYSLKSGAAPEEIEKYSRVFTLLLLMIVKHSLILGRKYDVQELRKLMKIEDFITIGALLMKTYKVVCLNCQLVATTTNDLCEFKNRTERCADSCCQMKAHAVLTRALIPLSCCPNISQFIINENHAISFTLSPIKKGEQLFTSIYSVYRFAPKLERQRVFRKRFHCYCECDMCINNWTERDLTSEENEESCAHTEKFKLKMLLAQANLAMNARSHDIELVSQVKEQVEKAWKYFKLPSKTLIEAVTLLIQCIQLVYFETGKMPGECSY
ncbi:hypothetical protein QAD02_018652 [Eretmocerus hayati]|uniref:Uncharacterized protein n=1 Tax=Eretmocerus hayati TaxID=131215 RepID=A0ACC2PM54_9HYME|nr:hypothetical protein QAD02_018652 [Eretmocerus hayati]